MSQSESDRDRLERMGKENWGKRVDAEKKRGEDQQTAADKRAAQIVADEQNTQEICDAFKPVFDGYKLPETGQTISVSLDKSKSIYFPQLQSDSLSKASVSMTHHGKTVSLFVALCRDGKYSLHEFKGATKQFRSIDEMKERVMEKLATLSPAEVATILTTAGISV